MADKHLVLAFGRMNPPTIGHHEVMKKLSEVAKKTGGDAHLVVSHTHDNNKNPIPPEHKVEYAKRMAPDNVHVHASNRDHPTLLHQLARHHTEHGYNHLTIVGGSDREEFADLAKKYNDVPGRHGHYNFKSINFESSGNRDPDSEGVEGMSGTKMREHARNNDEESFKKGLHKSLHPLAGEIMQHINNAVKESFEEFLDEALSLTQRRRKAMVMRRFRPKLKRMKRWISIKKAPEKNIQQRARKAAIRAVRKRVAGRKGEQYSSLSAADKSLIDKRVKQRQHIVDRLAKRLLPTTRKAELVRLTKMRSKKEEFNYFLESYSKINIIELLARKTNPTVANDTKHQYKDANQKGHHGKMLGKSLDSLKIKAKKNSVDEGLIAEVFLEGILDFDPDKPGDAVQQAFNAVNAFIAHYNTLDEAVKRGYQHPTRAKWRRYVKRKSPALRSKQSVSSKSSGMFRRRHAQHKRSAAAGPMGTSASATPQGITKRPAGGVSKVHRDLAKHGESDFRRIHGRSKSAMRQRLTREAKSTDGDLMNKDNYLPGWGTDAARKKAQKATPGQPVTEAQVWDKPIPKSERKGKLSPSQKARAKARAKAAGRPYPNMVDNIAVSKKENYVPAGGTPSVGTNMATKPLPFKGKNLKNVKEQFDIFCEEEKLGKISRTPGGPKKFMVKVRDKSTGNVKTVRFGDPNLSIKRDNPERRKSFRARHNCADPGPRTKARYWSCKQWRASTPVQDSFDMMLSANFFLGEAATDTSKLTHLDHVEDHVINSGRAGFRHATDTLRDVHNKLKGQDNETSITTKYDGSPSVVWGHHPETGQFFVGSKSVFNKNPKLNFTHEDIERNHEKSPGLVTKLKTALDHLPKITPKGKIYQGDIMHSGVQSDSNPNGDVEEKDGSYHFKPNTISYSTPKNGEHGKKIGGSKLGIVAHTEYTGDSLDNMKATFNADTSSLKDHKDVHVVHAGVADDTNYPASEQRNYEHHMMAAHDEHEKAGEDWHSPINSPDHAHTTHLNTYINKTVRESSKPTIQGYKDHVQQQYQKKADGVKTDKAKQAHLATGSSHLDHVDDHEQHFQSALNMHHHLQKAKDVLVNALSSSKSHFDHHIANEKVKPEGFVASRNNMPSKLVDRAEFSRMNFLKYGQEEK